MDAPTSVAVKPSTSVAAGDRLDGRSALKMSQTGAGHYQGYTGSNYAGSTERDSFKIDIDAYDISMDIAPTTSSSSSDLRQRALLNGGTKDRIMGPIQPFARPQQGLLSKLIQEFRSVIAVKEARRVVILGVFDISCMFVLLLWCQSTNSMALSAYTYLTACDLMLLVTCLITIWVAQQKPVSVYSFGFERLEVLAVFSCTMLAIFGAIFIMKESVERLFEPADVHTGRLMLGGGLGLVCHVTVTYGANSSAFRHVIQASRSSWLQEHFADMSRNFCSMVPGLDRLLLPRVNPFILIAMAGGLSLLVTDFLVDVNNYFVADPLAAIGIALMTFGTMLPMSIYTGTILLQTSPTHLIGQLDKSLREASTLDGVLEFCNEHFWTVSFGSIAGSLHVRVRRDANEQMVLAHVSNKLSHLVATLTVQVVKDDWTRLAPLSSFPSQALSPKLPPPAPLDPNLVAGNLGLYSSAVPAARQPPKKKRSLYDFQLPGSTPSRAASTPAGTPSRGELSFHSGIDPIASHREPTGVPFAGYGGDFQLKGILKGPGAGPRTLPPNMASSRTLASGRNAVIDVNSLGTANLYKPGQVLADVNHLNFDT